jgi:hypothetical protein
MKTLIVTLIAFALMGWSATAQTNVSGGIYANTTWTLNNSPYIVTDTIVVFPNVTLTIEPGVVVKFDNTKYMEIRQAQLIAIGTSTDSITFTSNSTSPTPGIWGDANNGGIFLNGVLAGTSFNFVNLEYATIGINDANSNAGIKNSSFINNTQGMGYIIGMSIDSCVFKFNFDGINNIAGSQINSCTFSNNTTGIITFSSGTIINCVVDSNQNGIENVNGGELDNCEIDYNNAGLGIISATINNCSISHNQSGLTTNMGEITIRNSTIDYNSSFGMAIVGNTDEPDSVINCEINFNGIGLVSEVCSIHGSHGLVTHCDIEGNATGIQVNGCYGALELICNSFCNNTTYNMENLSSASFNVPGNNWCSTDSVTIHSHIKDGYNDVNLGLITVFPIDNSGCSPATGIPSIPASNSGITVFPNPATTILNIHMNQLGITNYELRIMDIAGREVYKEMLTGIVNYQLSIVNWNAGLYFYEIRNNNSSVRGKFVKEL